MNRKRLLAATAILGLFACGGSKSEVSGPETGAAGEPAKGSGEQAATAKPERKLNDAGEFRVSDADKSSRPKQAKLRPTATEAAVRFFVIDKNKGPVKGIVVALTSPSGKKFYTEETDAEGFVEVLLPIGKSYELVYLSLGRRDVKAKVTVADKPNLNLKLTIRYEREEYPLGLVLDEINFPTGKATLTNESHRRLGSVLEYMTYKKSARIEISGHTDSAGSQRANKKLSQQRADSVRDYLISQGVAPDRITAVGYGDEKPIASNDTPEGREKNRRIEAKEL